MSALTDEQLRYWKEAQHPIAQEYMHGMATELIALRAKHVKLVGALKLAMPFVVHYSDDPSKKATANRIRELMGDPLAQSAESGATLLVGEKPTADRLAIVRAGAKP